MTANAFFPQPLSPFMSILLLFGVWRLAFGVWGLQAFDAGWASSPAGLV